MVQAVGSGDVTCIDPPVLDVIGNASDHQASSLNSLGVEVPNQLVTLAVDPRRPQRARIQTLLTLHLNK